ncbi:MAG: stage II sporulation protein P [Roseburia sp.]
MNKKGILSFGLSVILLLLLWEGRESLGELYRSFFAAGYEEMQETFLPGVVYGAREEPFAIIEELLLSFFPIGAYENQETVSYTTQSESELSYELILAWEAADENYVGQEIGVENGTGSGEEVTENGDIQPEVSDGAAKTSESEAAWEEESEKADGQSGEEKETDAGADGEDSVTAENGQQEVMAGLAPGKVVDYPIEKLMDYDYLIQNFYQVDSSTTITSEQLDAQELLQKDMKLTHDADSPQILIYHTHGQEGYVDSVAGDVSTGIIGVGDYLTEILTEEYGLNVIHHTGIYDTDRDTAYSRSGPALEQILADNPSIEVVIDLHRDGVGENTRLVTTQNGVEMAKIMFFNGLSRLTKTGDIGYLPNPYIQDNLALSLQMQLAAAEYYPDLTRRIYLKGYRYNMHYCPKTLLIEVGAQTNTLQEAKNAMVPLADLLNRVLTGQE